MTESIDESESKLNLNLFQRISQIMKDLPYLKKGASVGYGNNSYTAMSHDDVTEALNPLMVKYGIVSLPSMVNTEISNYMVDTKKGKSIRYETKCSASVTFVNRDAPEERFEVISTAHSFDTQDKSCGKAYSMAIKYCYLKTFMIASGDDEEQRTQPTQVVNQSKPQQVPIDHRQKALVEAVSSFLSRQADGFVMSDLVKKKAWESRGKKRENLIKLISINNFDEFVKVAINEEN